MFGKAATPPARITKYGRLNSRRAILHLVALEVSSFKCGHDAPIYGVIEGIIEQSGTPYFSFKDLDENKPSGSIRIRVETIDYFLRRYREDIIKPRSIEGDIQAQLAALERSLRSEARDRYEMAAAGDGQRAMLSLLAALDTHS